MDSVAITIDNGTKSPNYPRMSREIESQQTNTRIAIYCMIGCIILFGLPLPLTEIILAITHYSEVECDSFIELPTWLIVHGSDGVFVVALCITIIYYSLNPDSSPVKHLIVLILMSLNTLFSFAWIICGSVMFWRDCIHTPPHEINVLMWVSLIAGLFASFSTLKFNSKK